MVKRLFLFIGLIAILLFAFGCGGDDSGTNSQKIDGDLSDPTFQMARSNIEGFEEFAPLIFGSMLGTVDTVFGIGAQGAVGLKNFNEPFTPFAASDSVLLAYHESSNYWYIYMNYNDTSLVSQQTVVTTFIVFDSVQFLHGATPVQWPDSNLLTGINTGARMEISSNMYNSGNIVVTHQFSVVGDFLNLGDVTLNGTNGAVVTDLNDGSGCIANVDFTGTATNVVVNLASLQTGDFCPSSGTMTNSGTMAFSCTGQYNINFSDSWLIAQTYNSGAVHTEIENSTTRWVLDETCSSPLSSALVF